MTRSCSRCAVPLWLKERARPAFPFTPRPHTLRRLGAARLLRRLLRERRFDVVHANEAHALTAAWLAGAHRRTPVVVSRRVAFPLNANRLARRALSGSAACPGHLAFRGAERGGLRPARRRCPRGLRRSRGAAPAYARVPPARPRAMGECLQVTHCLAAWDTSCRKKAKSLCCARFPAIRARIPNCRLLLAGEGPSDGPCRSRLERLAEQLGVHSAVRVCRPRGGRS